MELYCRADVIDDEIASLMSRAGCTLVQMGVESADEKLLEHHGKNIKTEQIRKAFAILKANGIDVGAHFISGCRETRLQACAAPPSSRSSSILFTPPST